MLDRSGERRAAIESLERSYAYNEDPEERAEIAGKLGRLQASEEFAAEEAAMTKIESLGKADWPFLTKTELLLLGPFPDPTRCAGWSAGDDLVCTRDWDRFVAEPPAPPP